MNRNAKLVMEPGTPQRNYKDTLFRMIFKEPEDLLTLYNAVNSTDYQNPEDLQIVTLENAIYMNMKNDLAFIIDCRMSMYEHQGSVNPNMPLRYLLYVSREYSAMVGNQSLYSSKLVKLPTPYFVVFYNGTVNQPERREMKLSDAFLTPVEEPALELKFLQLNIGIGHNRELMEKCPKLAQYSQYVGRVHQYAEEMPLKDAVERAVNECIQEDILADFLRKNRAEAIEVSIFEYDEEKELEKFRAAEHELAREELRDEVKAEVKEELRDTVKAEVKEELRDTVKAEVKEELRDEVRTEVKEAIRAEVREEARTEALVEQVCRKLRKNKSPEIIAEELEEDLEHILLICKIASKYAPEYDSHQVYENLKAGKK